MHVRAASRTPHASLNVDEFMLPVNPAAHALN